MWTYRPQKRQVGSAFALTYRLRLRSCKLMGAFVISPLPPMLLEPLQNSRAPSLHGHYSASPLLRTRPSPSRRSPTSRFRRLYGSLLRRFRSGARRASPVAWRILVIVLSLLPARVSRRIGQIATFHAAFTPLARATGPLTLALAGLTPAEYTSFTLDMRQ